MNAMFKSSYNLSNSLCESKLFPFSKKQTAYDFNAKISFGYNICLKLNKGKYGKIIKIFSYPLNYIKALQKSL